MSTSIVLTVIGKDHPGIVETLSQVLASHDGNWTHSSMSSLAGQFAGILLADVPADRAQACIAALEALDSEGLRVVAHAGGEEPDRASLREFSMDLVGHDRRGIVHDITHILAEHGVNVQELETEVESASMAGGTLFRARARMLAPGDLDLERLERKLEDLANELMVEIRFED